MLSSDETQIRTGRRSVDSLDCVFERSNTLNFVLDRVTVCQSTHAFGRARCDYIARLKGHVRRYLRDELRGRENQVF